MQSRIRHAFLLSAALLSAPCAFAGEMGETAFSRLDANGDGYLSARELMAPPR